jgi:U3 small nucleolar RNA-associated protein 10
LDEERAFDILTIILTFPSVPHSIVRDLTANLTAQTISIQEGNGVIAARCRALLVHVQQRHPDLLQACFQTALADSEGHKDVLEQLLISLSVELPGASRASSGRNDADMIVASTSADAAVRVIAVRELYMKLSTSNYLPLELVSQLHQAFITILDNPVVIGLDSLSPLGSRTRHACTRA